MGIVNASISEGDQIENVRLGTRKQYISQWTLIKSSQAVYFEHGLGEIPWNVTVCVSETSDGAGPTPAGDVVIEFTDLGQKKPGEFNRGSEESHIRLTSFHGNGPLDTGLYFEVRAM